MSYEETLRRIEDAKGLSRYIVMAGDGVQLDGFCYTSLGLAEAEAQVHRGYVIRLDPTDMVADFRP